MRQVQRLWNVSMKIRSSPRSRRVALYALDAAKAAGVRRVVLVSSILTDGRTMGATDSPGFKITNAFGGTAACLQVCHATRTLRRPRHILDRVSASLSHYSHIASSTSYTRQNVCKSVTLLAHASSTSYTRRNVCKSVTLFVHASSTSYTRIPFPYLLVPSFSCNE